VINHLFGKIKSFTKKKKTTSTNITREGDFLHKKVVAHKQWFFLGEDFALGDKRNLEFFWKFW
jgi:hypothetical protein